MQEAKFYTKIDNKVRCSLCPHNCLIPEGKTGFCGVRKNEKGKLYTLVYGRVIASSLDPIEKKPLYHFYPGSKAYSIATIGCNFKCLNCQNADISQIQNRINPLDATRVEPEDVVNSAMKEKAKSIAYTYTEPTIFYEFAYDTAELAAKKGLKNVLISNGYINKEPLETIMPFIDAANIDLKFFSDDLYRQVCSGSLQPVLDTIKLLKKHGVWVEVTTLIIPGYNDDNGHLSKIAKYIAEIDEEIPWHVSAFFPTFKMTDIEPTARRVLFRAREIGLSSGLKYVYCGNVYADEAEDTYCQGCKKIVINRSGYQLTGYHIKDSKCEFCQQPLAGEFKQ